MAQQQQQPLLECSANSRVYYAILFHHFLPHYPHTLLLFLLSEVTNHNTSLVYS